ncbi:hypothetical protein TD95_001177 [Thielaviopsis punctulata]|uniref:Uncharacterized protein n=1 Tax=Thielaviopsis punctulata TaxID=72032 RepID=A0A0F4ZJB4_9PEZI|nr:hypothetical protein TD95_001177 [Thielaviopsis punctulata]
MLHYILSSEKSITSNLLNGKDERRNSIIDSSSSNNKTQPISTHQSKDRMTDHPRLNLPTDLRLLLTSTSAFLSGALLGMAHGGRTAQLRFRAEHAHKMPQTVTGWYLYHKSKNYHAAQGALREGARMGARVGFWTGLVVLVESVVDGYRGRRDGGSTAVAGTAVAGVFSLYHGFNLPMFARTARYGLCFGLAYGGLQDALTAAQGRADDLGYVQMWKRHFSPSSSPSPPSPSSPSSS